MTFIQTAKVKKGFEILLNDKPILSSNTQYKTIATHELQFEFFLIKI